MRNATAAILVSTASLAGLSCKDGGPDVNLLSLEDDLELGAQLHEEILSNPDEYPLLDPEAYPDAYAHLYRIRDAILASDDVRYRDTFEWQLYILHDDEVLNAFAAPGGYIYVYTGLIRFLEREDDLAGVLGHEIAHADRRHSTQQLTKAYGVNTLLEVLLGKEPGLIADIAASLVNLRFSRADEAESDEYSVRYLCDTDWAADGAAAFFEMLLEDGGLQVPEFLSTHPSSESRVENIRAKAQELGCSTEPNPDAQYQALLDALP